MKTQEDMESLQDPGCQVHHHLITWPCLRQWNFK